MIQPGRKYSVDRYRYGFNGKENDNDVKGEANLQDYGMRIYDPRLGRFLSVDPLIKEYPELTAYQFASNNPIDGIDLDGAERLEMRDYSVFNRTVSIDIIHTTEIVTAGLAPELAGLNNRNYASRFRNTTLYVDALPQNGQPINFITRQQYETGVGIAIQINFRVNLAYIATAAAATIDAAHSTLSMAPNAMGFGGIMSFARGSINAPFTVTVNPTFDAFATNNGVIIAENYEELIAHETGFHNMMGLRHAAGPGGVAIYPAGQTLESNQHGNILSTNANVQQILTMGITNRSNLVNLVPPDTRRDPVQTVGGAAPAAPNQNINPNPRIRIQNRAPATPSP